MELTLKILMALFYLVAIGALGFQAYLSFRSHRDYKDEKELMNKKLEEFIRQQCAIVREQRKTHLQNSLENGEKSETVN